MCAGQYDTLRTPGGQVRNPATETHANPNSEFYLSSASGAILISMLPSFILFRIQWHLAISLQIANNWTPLVSFSIKVASKKGEKVKFGLSILGYHRNMVV